MNLRSFFPALAILTASLIFATDSVVRHRGGLSPLDVNATSILEYFIGWVVIVPWVFLKRKDQLIPRSGNDLLLFLVIGIGGGTVAGTLYEISSGRLGPELAAIFPMGMPLFVLIFAHTFLKERFSSFFMPCALWVVANTILMSLSPSTLAAFEEGSISLGGVLIALTATAFWGGSTVAGKSLTARYNSTTILFWRWSFAILGMLVAQALRSDAPAVEWGAYLEKDRLLSLLYLGVVTQSVAYWFYYQGLRKVPASVATFLELLYPLGAVILFAGSSNFTFLQAFGAVNLALALTLLLAMEYPKAVRDSANSRT